MSRSVGTFGENWAAAYLTRLGYHIVERNVRYREGEIDIVARDGEELVFVEVKCRRGSAFGSPEESITAARFARLAAAAAHFLEQLAPEQPDYRVDVIAIELDQHGAVARSRHLRSVGPPGA